MQLGYWPRITIKHTSGSAEGQIYVPGVNFLLMVGCLTLVLAFQDSARLASAYGIAVTGTMAATTVLFFGVARRWGWNPWLVTLLVLGMLTIDLAFFSANLHKIVDGGWVPLVIGAAVFTLMTTWSRGRALLLRSFAGRTLKLTELMEQLQREQPHRVRGTAVFMTSNPNGVPPVLTHYYRHSQALHEQVLFLSIATEHVPEIGRAQRVESIVDLGNGFTQVRARYGFMQTPNVLELMDLCAERGLETRDTDTSYFLGRETLILTRAKGMARWRKRLFARMSRNAQPANAFFQIPPDRVVELGAQIEL